LKYGESLKNFYIPDGYKESKIQNVVVPEEDEFYGGFLDP
jgi:hypothetical protein